MTFQELVNKKVSKNNMYYPIVVERLMKEAYNLALDLAAEKATVKVICPVPGDGEKGYSQQAINSRTKNKVAMPILSEIEKSKMRNRLYEAIVNWAEDEFHSDHNVGYIPSEIEFMMTEAAFQVILAVNATNDYMESENPLKG